MGMEERIFEGVLFPPGDPELRAIKARAHRLSALYSRTMEEDVEERAKILQELVGRMGQNCFIQGPIFFHYGKHITIGDRFFGNYNLTIQDDAKVTIGNDVNLGPNVTIVTPEHPLIASERRMMLDWNGEKKRLCYARPVTIGNDVWVGGNVTICGGVTIGNGVVIGAGSVVTRDIPDNCVAVGVPAKVLRPITQADSMANHPERLGGCSVLPEE